MTIRWKVSALIAALLAVFGVSELFVAHSVLLPSFIALEQSEADVAMRRVRYALDRSLEQLALSATSWGNWADTYRFARDHNQRFVDDNLTVIGLQQLAVNAVLIMDGDGRVVASAALDLESSQPADDSLLRRFVTQPDFPWRIHLRDGRAARGILRTNGGILLVTEAPILNGFGNGTPRGMVIMGRFLSPGEVSSLGAQAQVALSVLPPVAPTGRQRIAETQNNTTVYESLDDIYGRPALTLRVDVPREITRRGRSAVYYSTACLMGTAVIVVILLILILNRVVLDPLARVIRHAATIGEDSDLTNRLDFDRADEIGVLAREFDRMVARVAESRSQLVDQSFQAGFAELAKGVLHNLGNAMTPIGVRLALLQERLHSIDGGDFQLAAQELSSTELDAERRNSVIELLRLAGGALDETLQDARQDVEVLTRQASVVQSALSEQMSSTRNEHVWEVVRMTDVLAQSLEVVPDTASGRLSIETDDSFDEIGTVCVPRTVLRLVLQNVIINAADSINQSGRSQGSLKIAAQIARAAGREQLVLHFTDNGVGITADCLPRIFEKGFSTKSQDTNFGIGLHWCANALGALGGRVWATSEGVGHGASLHILIPLRSLAERASEAA